MRTAAAASYLQDEMLFTRLLILLASSHRPPALTLFILEQVECRDSAVSTQHLQRAFLRVLRRLRNPIHVQRD